MKKLHGSNWNWKPCTTTIIHQHNMHSCMWLLMTENACFFPDALLISNAQLKSIKEGLKLSSEEIGRKAKIIASLKEERDALVCDHPHHRHRHHHHHDHHPNYHHYHCYISIIDIFSIATWTSLAAWHG